MEPSVARATDVPVAAPSIAIASQNPLPVVYGSQPSSASPRANAAGAAALTVWADAPAEDIPSLPQLPEPAAIAVEAIEWDAVAIAPLEVALIEVGVLAIEPLETGGRSGV
jgi:hypothetical protein